MPGEPSTRPADGPVRDPAPDRGELAVARRLLNGEEGRSLLASLRGSDERTLADQEAVTRIAAPPFREGNRAAWMAERFTELGLDEVGIDPTGNACGLRPGTDPGAIPLVLSAHLDTVFPAETVIDLRREGDVIHAPGISDDGRGLAALLAIARTLRGCETVHRHPIVFAATVGEEGLGDLRGVRALFEEGLPRGAHGFVSLDGAGLGQVVSRGVGSRRYRVELRGPGGHSRVDWQRPNPIRILAELIAALPTPPDLPPGTTWSVGRIRGGTAVNAIPESAWAEVEIRAERAEEIDRVEGELRAALDTALEQANRLSPTGRAESALSVIGDRPAGATPAHRPLVRAAVAATRALGFGAELSASSTDANLPMSLGIPAITVGAGGEAGGAHTLAEWYRNRNGPEGIARGLLTLLLCDRWAEEGLGSAGDAPGVERGEAAD